MDWLDIGSAIIAAIGVGIVALFNWAANETTTTRTITRVTIKRTLDKEEG